MNKYKFGVTGQERKALAGAISELLTQPTKDLGAPTFAYEIGGYHIDKEGTVIGEYDANFLVGLAKLGFEPETFENEKFTMRVWLIGLGMVGKEYALARKLLLKNLEGNSSWRYGTPKKATPVETEQEANVTPAKGNK
jgi:hypothetical protein